MRFCTILLLATIIPIFGESIVLHAPSLRIFPELADSAVVDSARVLRDGDTLRNGDVRAYILLCDNQILEISEYSSLIIMPYLFTIQLIKGTFTLHNDSRNGEICYRFSCDSSEIRFASEDSARVNINGSMYWLNRSMRYLDGEIVHSQEKWFVRSDKNARYLFSYLRKHGIPRKDARLDFPSSKPPIFKQRSRGYGGLATYEGERYYYFGAIWTARLWRFEFAYDFWGAWSKKGEYYDEAWNRWRDLLDHIHHITLFRPEDPVYIRAGLIENLFFGHGLLVEHYNNAVFLPFDKRNGLEMQLKTHYFKTSLFMNDIGYPRVAGVSLTVHRGDNVSLSLSYAGDFDIFDSISDEDGDGYPDRLDPEPENYNDPQDSVILDKKPSNINDLGKNNLHGLSFSGDFMLLKRKNLRSKIFGEMATLSNTGVGIMFPNISINSPWVSLSVGLDLQTPSFIDGVFDRNYESRKAYFVEKEGELVLASINSDLSEAEGWLYGWNNSVAFAAPGYFRLNTSFKDIYREDARSKRFQIVFNLDYSFSYFITKTSFFLEQKNVSQFLQKKTDGENWGFELGINPHESVKMNLRYRVRYTDENLDGEISGGEIQRNLSANVSIDGNYWWREFLDWRASRNKVSE